MIKKLFQKKLYKDEKIIYIDGSVTAAVEHCKTYIITFRGSKTKSEYIVIYLGILMSQKQKL